MKKYGNSMAGRSFAGGAPITRDGIGVGIGGDGGMGV